jgi:putative hydrolase of the HAD superfamily
LRAIIFDGDDTLWQTEHLYDTARSSAREVVEGVGLDGEAWEARERLIDVENVARFGHGVDRFPTSCVEAYEDVAAATGVAVEAGARQEIDRVARGVFERRVPLVDGAEETLSALRACGYRLALLTKGDPAVQSARIEQSGLRGLFDSIAIVAEKTPEAIHSVLARLEVLPADALTVGNSVRSDVLPSLAAGVTPVWIDAHVWEYERQHAPYPSNRVVRGKELTDLVELLCHEDS